jgi:hypothetical protein
MKKKETANNQMHLRKKNMKVSELNRTNTLNPILANWLRSTCPKRKKETVKGTTSKINSSVSARTKSAAGRLWNE